MQDEYYKKIFSKNLKYYMELNGKSQVDIVNDLGINKSAISTWCNGTRLPRMDKVNMLAQYFNITRSDLIEEHKERTQTDIPNYPNIRPISTQSLPMLGSIACGEPVLMSMDRKSYVQLGTEVKADFCLTAKGDSMINARIHDGDIVFIRKQDMVENGEIAAVAIDDEATTTKSSPFSYYGLKIHLTRTRRIPGKR